MKIIISALILFSFCHFLISWTHPVKDFIAKGNQPELSIDSKGELRMVFGRNDSIFYSSSLDKGESFSTPVLVGHIPQMHLGMSRGPQIASSLHYTMVTAMDKAGNIHWFLLNNETGIWINKDFVNDNKGSAPEGLMGLASDDHDKFYAVWLDLRLNKHNNICFSSFSAKDGKWSKNKMIYQSPDGHTCECCKPNIAVRGNHIAVMFRNWLNGSRDLYLTESVNGGNSFGNAQKLGRGTWKLNGCPMDGGGLVIDEKDQVITIWQRLGEVYICKQGQKEVMVDKGRSCSLTAFHGKIICCYQNGDEVKMRDIVKAKETLLGNGNFPHSIILHDQSVAAVWEKGGEIHYKRF